MTARRIAPALMAACGAMAGCQGGSLIGMAVLIAIVIAASIRNGVELSEESCPHCGKAGATATRHEKGFVDEVTCDHCGKQI